MIPVRKALLALKRLDDGSRTSLIKQWRRQRLLDFVDRVRPPQGARIIDLGGTRVLWDLIEHDFKITLVNLPGSSDTPAADARYDYIADDATGLRHRYGDRSFDVAYSNSVIEHVGGGDKQAAFAAEARRLGRGYWVQTPSTRFPIEVHTGLPFYWQYPEWYRRYLLNSWRKTLPGWTADIAGTRVLSRATMQTLFPDAEVYIERKLGFEKSYAFYRAWQPN